MTRLIPAWSVALSLVAAPALAQVRADLVASGFSQPVAFVQDPSQPDVQVIVEQGGRVRVLQGGVVRPDAFLDLSGQVLFSGERGLLGLAFAPDYATSGRLFVNFVNQSGHTVIARFRRSAGDPLRADPATQFNLVWPDGNAFILQPFTNHKGGNVVFGPDGYLYIGMGDGGSSNDPDHRAQNPLTLLGKMLRLDVSVADSDPQGYDVPADNPFVGRSGVLPEIWAFGLRNPWRFNFDDPLRGGTGALVIADVGQGAWEEIDYEPAGRGGRNYGWRNREGAHDGVTTLPPFFTPLTDPIFEYSHATGRSVTGGYVYRGTAMGSPYAGRYFYGDFVNGRIWSLGLAIDPSSGEASVADVAEHTAELGAAAASPSSFGVDAGGELYVLNYNAGAVYRIVSSASLPPPFGKRAPANGTSGLTGAVTLTWGLVADAGYQVCVTTTGPACDTVWQPTGMSRTVELTGLARGKYHWQVRSVSGSMPEADNGTWWSFTVGRAASSDFGGDLTSDVLWRHRTHGDVWLWPMDGAARMSETYVRTVSDPNWEIRGLGDQTGDGKADVLWRNKVTGQIYLWPMDGATPQDEISVGTVDTAYDIVGTGDFDGDGKSDILWRQTTLGDVWVWLMDGATPQSENYIDRVDPGYVVKGVGDLDADGMADIVWQGAAGDVWVWPMNGTTRLDQVWVGTVPDTGYRIVGVADYTGGGQAGILWHHATRGDVWIWTMNGPARLAETWVGTVPDTGYQIVGTGDYNGDTRADILWHHATRGEVWVWLMDGTTKMSEAWVATVPDAGYQVVKVR